jgi:hypothetical protein
MRGRRKTAGCIRPPRRSTDVFALPAIAHAHFGGDTSFITGLKSKNKHELAFRLGIAL